MNEQIKELRHDSEKAQKFFAKQIAYTLGPIELKELMDEGKVKLVDVRANVDYEINHIPGAISIPKDELGQRIGELSKDEINVVYCYNQQCHLGVKAAYIIAEYGYPVMLLEGGYKTWVDDFRFAVTQ